MVKRTCGGEGVGGCGGLGNVSVARCSNMELGFRLSPAEDLLLWGDLIEKREARIKKKRRVLRRQTGNEQYGKEV